MDILSYLTQIIKARKEVEVPGLGTFYKKKFPGRYSTETHSFLPPSYVLDFTTDIKEETTLRDFISKKANISADNVTYYIDQFVLEIKGQLENGEDVQLGELGVLSSGTEGLIFSPNRESNIGLDFYGMPDIKDESLPTPDGAHTEPEENDKDEIQQAEDDRDEQQIYEEISEARIPEQAAQEIYIETPENMDAAPEITEPTPVPVPAELQYNFGNAEEERGMAGYLKVIFVVSILVIAAIATYVIKPELFKKPNKHNIDSHPEVISTAIQSDSAAYTDSTAKANMPQIGSVVDSSLQDSALNQQPDTLISYEIIAASLLNRKEADDFLKEMERRGIPAKIANMPGKRVKISIGTFTDEETANTQLKLLRKTTRIPGIYIYTNRHTNNTK